MLEHPISAARMSDLKPASLLHHHMLTDVSVGSFSTDPASSILQCDCRCPSKTGHEFNALIQAARPWNLNDSYVI